MNPAANSQSGGSDDVILGHGLMLVIFRGNDAQPTDAPLTLLAGTDADMVDAFADRLFRTRGARDDGRVAVNVLEFAPIMDRDAIQNFRRAPSQQRPESWRIQGKVLRGANWRAEDQIAALADFVWDCASAWAYSQPGAGATVIVELDDFCEYVGTGHVLTVLYDLQSIATRLRLPVLAIAHVDVRNLLGSASDAQAAGESDASYELPSRTAAGATQSASAPPPTAGETARRHRDPHAREQIAEAIRTAPGTPKQLAERIYGRMVTAKQRASVRKLLQHMRADGNIILRDGTYRLDAPHAGRQPAAGKSSGSNVPPVF